MNNSVTRTLKTNNRDLARILELTRLELKSAQSLVLSLQQELQSAHVRAAELKRLAEANEHTIEEEVQRRIQVSDLCP